MSWADIGTHVRRARAARRQTQAEFAEEVGLSIRTVGALENGTQQSYDETTILRIESALGWAPGSFERVVAGGRPRAHVDTQLARVLDAWPRLTPGMRRALAELAGALISPLDSE